MTKDSLIKTAVDKETMITILEDIAVMLELSGENPFKSRAYLNAARSLEKIDEDLVALTQNGKIFEIEGVGEAIGKKLIELITTGKLEYYETLKASIPPGHMEMLKISGLGPKKIHTLHQELGITTIGELEYACHENRLVDLKGFGKKTQDNILAGIEKLKRYSERRLYDEVSVHAEALLAFLKKNKDVQNISLAGSLRRGNETVKDIDILAVSVRPERLGNAFAGYGEAASVIARGDTKVSITLKAGINADLRIVTPDEYPYALHHFTGSREHNVAMRGRAKDLGLKMNEYGLFRGEKNITCRSEEEIFTALGLGYIEPELRENMGEIEAAERGELPRLIEAGDLCGVFHVHTNFSDGTDHLEHMVLQVKKMGLQYIGVSDHSQSAFYAGGLNLEQIAQQHAEIDRLNEKHAPFCIFKGIESDIGPTGDLDYDEEILARFDFVIAAVHSGFKMTETEMTARIKKALANPFTTMLAHPTGRLLLSREPYAVNIKDVLETAAAHGKALELNANPQRLDLDWRNCRQAIKKGVKIAINPDAHSVNGLQHVVLGVKIARKGWITKEDCLNCLSLKQIKTYFARKH